MAQQNPATVPLTVSSSQTIGTEVAVVIGSNYVAPPSNWPNSYWYLAAADSRWGLGNRLVVDPLGSRVLDDEELNLLYNEAPSLLGSC